MSPTTAYDPSPLGFRRSSAPARVWPAIGVLSVGAACTLDVGDHFQVAEVVYDESFFYCQVEPMLFAQGCGSGDPGLGESAQGCHFTRQGLRLTEYGPLVAESCNGSELSESAPSAAQRNYQSSQLFMELDAERSPLLTRPTSDVAHPRVVISADSEEADLIRSWGTRYASQ